MDDQIKRQNEIQREAEEAIQAAAVLLARISELRRRQAEANR